MLFSSSLVQLQTQALALTRPKTPKKEQSGSPPGNMQRDRQSESLQSPSTADVQHSHSRSSSKTPINVNSGGNEHTNAVSEMNSPIANAKIAPSPLPSSEKSNHHGDGAHNNGLSNSQPFSSANGPDKILPSPFVEKKDFDFSKVNGELQNFF